MSTDTRRIIITGITESGEKFRPADWAERMCGYLCILRNRRLVYSPLLQPGVKAGEKCIMLDPALEASNPELYETILTFARTNHLKTCREDENL